ncbi:hypothetical protein F2Q68_00031079 [Brassica cretica]|uniref:Uncharacterized protein n=1 Tax=Brassica cretica TaxID=69181 RepID=A0A8S9GE14_BRACR|nr:hypothetical protein F2Q68_00031079 [Brassica cretica]
MAHPNLPMASWICSIQLTVGRVRSGSSNSPNGELDRPIQPAVGRVELGLSNFPDGGSGDAGLVVPMLGNCPFDGLNDPCEEDWVSWKWIIQLAQR